ncbi:hypothetical protein [Silvanigrella aquatica]|uniref:Adenosine deaminase domain-containing protein n=1 Tax=Silvanigrella aquatica TaxID=1915309 RepID=A0A1L4D293_9BACT|nr:hypothetical protein [Silvanigrella aquatica]APJ04310.1 hypothetical protein AXG55_10490 [Silvanigrella aquatica]
MKKLYIFLFVLNFSIFQNLNAIDKNINLEKKLELQWKNYDKARELLLQKAALGDVPLEEKLISREDWEKLIALSPSEDFTDDDLLYLKTLQEKRIYKAKIKAKYESIIDLTKVRHKQLEKQFCEQFPKGGMLHVHPSGTLDRNIANILLQKNNPVLEFDAIFNDIDNSSGNKMLYPSERLWLSNLPKGAKYSDLTKNSQNKFQSFLFLPAGKQPFPRFNSVFSFLNFATPDNSSYQQSLLAFVNKAAKEGVIYIEFTGTAKPQFYDTLSYLENQTGVTLRLNNAFRRTKDIKNLNDDWNKFINSSSNKYLVGIDFLDNEENNPSLEKGQFIYSSALFGSLNGTNKLHRTMHSGEIGLIEDPRDSMIMGVERMGHGVNLSKDIIALEYASRNKMPIEINISSNLRLTSIDNVKQHPFIKYLRLGLPVSLSTDDEGMFDIDINNECTIALKKTDISYAELKQMSYNSITTSFAAKEDKDLLKIKLDHLFYQFEKSSFVQNLDLLKISSY